VTAAASATLWVAACAPRRPPVPPSPIPLPAEIRIGVAVDVPSVTLSSDHALVFRSPERPDGIRAVGGTVTVRAGAQTAEVALDGAVQAATTWQVTAASRVKGTVVLDGKRYSGALDISAGPRGLVVVNRLDLEQYVAAVVSAEMGRRSASDLEALKAQAVVSRTYAVRHRQLAVRQPYDLLASRGDQIYNGAGAVTPLARRATDATRGEILTWHGTVIDAFFFSTCGGRTEDGTAVFAGADRPYLRAVSDLRPDGRPWCDISPRYSWNEHWNAGALRAVLARTLPANALPAARASDLTDVRVASRTASGRVAAIDLVGSDGTTTVTGQAIRRVLEPVAGDAKGALLWSTQFTIRVSRSGEAIEALDLSGHGSGHGVGMCQWGAIGRARAGQDYLTILTSYFPGTTVVQAR
jgi:stage II sporulation protein D (peptidoglycan lytic transglycosylase)